MLVNHIEMRDLSTYLVFWNVRIGCMSVAFRPSTASVKPAIARELQG